MFGFERGIFSPTFTYQAEVLPFYNMIGAILALPLYEDMPMVMQKKVQPISIQMRLLMVHISIVRASKMSYFSREYFPSSSTDNTAEAINFDLSTF